MPVDTKEINSLYGKCTLCPNNCGVDRTRGETGVCGETSRVRISWAGLHRGEEPPVSGKNGSGMVFFTGCSLHCRYCQNYQISEKCGTGYEVTVSELSEIMISLQKSGAATLNLVTGTHFIPSVIAALDIAKANGFSLPVVWNSSGYENVSALRRIDRYVDLYLLDVKTLDKAVAGKFCGLEKYSEAILPVVQFLKRRYPKTTLEEGNLKGVLVRHLVFPGCFDATMNFLEWYADNFKDCFFLSLMTQFVPPKKKIQTEKDSGETGVLSPESAPEGTECGFPPVSKEEYERLLDAADKLGADGFIQEPDGEDALWLPDFTRDNPFPKNFADVLPYFLEIKRR